MASRLRFEISLVFLGLGLQDTMLSSGISSPWILFSSLPIMKKYGPKKWKIVMVRDLQGSFPLAFLLIRLGGRRICISEALLQGLGVEIWWKPSAGLLSTHHFIHAAARCSFSPWVSYISSARTFPPASPRGISHPQSLKKRTWRDALIVQGLLLCTGQWDLALPAPWGPGLKPSLWVLQQAPGAVGRSLWGED